MIVPAILSDSLEEVAQQLHLSASAGFKRVQIDSIDPEYADNSTINPIDLLHVPLHDLQIDVHLMTNDPINDVVECSQIPGITTIIGQIEHMDSQSDFWEHIDSYSIQTGYSLDIYTPVEALEQSALEHAATIQVMGNKAGEQGQEFAGETVLQKIRELSEIRKDLGYSYSISVDIGMTPQTIALCKGAGANDFIVGSYLWKSHSFSKAIQELQKLA